jgi:hypothetical protein
MTTTKKDEIQQAPSTPQRSIEEWKRLGWVAPLDLACADCGRPPSEFCDGKSVVHDARFKESDRQNREKFPSMFGRKAR